MTDNTRRSGKATAAAILIPLFLFTIFGWQFLIGLFGFHIIAMLIFGVAAALTGHRTWKELDRWTDPKAVTRAQDKDAL